MWMIAALAAFLLSLCNDARHNVSWANQYFLLSTFSGIERHGNGFESANRIANFVASWGVVGCNAEYYAANRKRNRRSLYVVAKLNAAIDGEWEGGASIGSYGPLKKRMTKHCGVYGVCNVSFVGSPTNEYNGMKPDGHVYCNRSTNIPQLSSQGEAYPISPKEGQIVSADVFYKDPGALVLLHKLVAFSPLVSRPLCISSSSASEKGGQPQQSQPNKAYKPELQPSDLGCFLCRFSHAHLLAKIGGALLVFGIGFGLIGYAGYSIPTSPQRGAACFVAGVLSIAVLGAAIIWCTSDGDRKCYGHRYQGRPPLPVYLLASEPIALDRVVNLPPDLARIRRGRSDLSTDQSGALAGVRDVGSRIGHYLPRTNRAMQQGIVTIAHGDSPFLRRICAKKGWT